MEKFGATQPPFIRRFLDDKSNSFSQFIFGVYKAMSENMANGTLFFNKCFFD